ncbi:hypothetical protein AB835_13395 [Candidatus Endobugula sertula]|uniref:Thioesterase domain-containing protein n=1 Tax=Candidatus Endobugula sertula TaxID=62101 RepID=A0A1D2QLY9_9GAMM|nr:hypothetical protein AB835_13395 [Candidatus Endobugula sertula]
MNSDSQKNVSSKSLTLDDVFPLQQPSMQADINIFALPFAGGGASIYNRWLQLDNWPDNWCFCPVQLSGRENRIKEVPHKQMDSLIAELVNYIAPYTLPPMGLTGKLYGVQNML